MVVAIIVISLLGVLGMIICLLFFPTLHLGKWKLQTFWMPPFFAAIILLCSTLVPWDYFSSFLLSSSSINPLEILLLFLSMSFLSIVLDEAGFFSYLANKVVKKAGSNQFKVFIFLYLLTSVLTIFTSNDIIILTFTPFIIYFCKRTNVNPLPYLIGEFVSANTWSMLLLIGNPTNIYLAESFSISFFDYFLRMWPSALCGGVISFLITFLLFYKKLKIPFQSPTDYEEASIKDVPLLSVSLSILILCIVMMAIANFIHVPLWIISVSAASLLLVFCLIYQLIKKKTFLFLGHSLSRLPYEVIPFVLGMFVLVLGLKRSGLTANIATFLESIDTLWSYGIATFLSSNLFNNIPSSVLFLEIIKDGSASSTSIYSAIIATNVGAILSPIGALAGIMWMNLLKEHGVRYSFLDFLKYGVLISLPTLAVSLLCLYI